MKVFVDANILIAVLNKEYPLFSDAARVLSKGSTRGNRLFTTNTALAISFYFAEKKHGSKIAFQKIIDLSKHISIANCGENELKSTLENKKVKDFEDGLQYYSAVNSGCSVIVTEDKSGFYYSELPVVNSATFLNGNYLFNCS